MEDILHVPGANLGGNAELLFTHYKNLLHVPAPVDGIVTQDLVLAGGTKWYAVQVTRYTIYYSEQEDLTDAGLPVEIACGFVLSKSTPELHEKLRLLKRYKLAVLIRDQNGYTRLIGNSHEYVVHRKSLGVGQLPTDHNRYDLILGGAFVKGSVFYSGAVATEIAPVTELIEYETDEYNNEEYL